jgi:hypothetical protein
MSRTSGRECASYCVLPKRPCQKLSSVFDPSLKYSLLFPNELVPFVILADGLAQTDCVSNVSRQADRSSRDEESYERTGGVVVRGGSMKFQSRKVQTAPALPCRFESVAKTFCLVIWNPLNHWPMATKDLMKSSLEFYSSVNYPL